MKKLLSIILFIIIVGGFIKYTYTSNQCKNIDYAVQHYFTTGIFNSHKLYNMSAVNLSFSNGNIAVVKIDGMEKKSPHRKVSYNVFLEKNSRGIWKIQKIYPDQITSKSQ